MPPLPPLPAIADEQPVEDESTARPRLLTADEVATLEPIFTARGAPLPAPEHSYFVGTVDRLGNVTSFLVVQLRVHAEPMWIAPGNEHVFRPLVHKAEQLLTERVAGNVDVFLFAPAGKVARMAEIAGMRQEPWVVYSKMIEGQAQIDSAQVLPSKPKRKRKPAKTAADLAVDVAADPATALANLPVPVSNSETRDSEHVGEGMKCDNTHCVLDSGHKNGHMDVTGKRFWEIINPTLTPSPLEVPYRKVMKAPIQ